MAKQELAKTDERVNALALPDDLAAEIMESQGHGVSTKADDIKIPFYSLLQDMSPQVKKRDPAYIEGAEVGMIINTATKRLYAGDPKTATDFSLPQLKFQPCFQDRAVIQWIPRDNGGGFVARHELVNGNFLDTVKSLEGVEVEVTMPNGDVNKVWRTKDRKHDLIDTRYHYGNVLDEEWVPSPAVFGFTSTGHTASKELETLKHEKVNINGKVFLPDAWARWYTMGTKGKKNARGDFIIWNISMGGWVVNSDTRAAGKQLYESLASGAMQADYSQGDGGGSAAPQGDDSQI